MTVIEGTPGKQRLLRYVEFEASWVWYQDVNAIKTSEHMLLCVVNREHCVKRCQLQANKPKTDVNKRRQLRLTF